jgi:hypothetical protein
VPTVNVGYVTLLLGLSGLANSIWRNTRLLRGPWRMRRPDDMGFTQWLLIVIGTQVLPVVLYGSESALALLFFLRPGWRFPADLLTYVLLGAYAIGLIRAWELLGGTASGLSWLNRPVANTHDAHNAAAEAMTELSELSS